MLLLQQRVSVCLGDESRPPVPPRPLPPLAPPLAPLLAHPPVRAATDADAGGGTGGDLGPGRDRSGVPGLSPGVEGTEGRPGGGVTGHARGPTIGTGTGTGTGGDTRHADDPGAASSSFCTVSDVQTVLSRFFFICQVPVKLATGGQTRGSEQRRSPAGRQQQ